MNLPERLRLFARRHDFRSGERNIMREAADRIEALENELNGQPEPQVTGEVVITPEMVESAMGSRLLPWQRRKLER